jgi:hypothetical protein
MDQSISTALKVLELPENYTIDLLKHQYKALIQKHHPDRSINIASSPMFQILTGSYKILANALSNKNKPITMPSQTAHNINHHSQQQYQQPIHTQQIRSTPQNGKFNIDRFNALFDKHRFRDEAVDKGYEEWMSDPNSFKANDMRKSLKKYQEPIALNTTLAVKGPVGSANFYELGVNKVDDFSADNVNHRDLNFMDYRLAHTVQRIIDPDEVKQRKEYKSVQELEQDRSGMPMQMSRQEQDYWARKQKLEEQHEQKRLKKMNQYDQKVSEYYSKTQHLF